MRDAGGELAQGSELLGLDQPILRGAQIVERLRQFPRALLNLGEQACVLDGDHGLVGKGLHQFDLLVRERAGFRPPEREHAFDGAVAHQRHRESRAIAAEFRPGAEIVIGIG